MNSYYIAGYPVRNELYHHGILGQKWGVRRYQNPDGTLTTEGRARYGDTKQERKEARRELSIERGNVLLDKGRTKAGAIGRGIGREAAIMLGKTAIAAIAAGTLIKTLESNDLADSEVLKIAKGTSVIDGILAAGAVGLTAANVVKTVKQYKDISRAKKNRENKQ